MFARRRPAQLDQFGCEGAISTPHDVSAFNRALVQGRLLPADLQAGDVTACVPGCGGTIAEAGGSIPGYNSTTFSSTDGRVQSAVAITLKVKNRQIAAVGAAVSEPAEAVLCPN